MGCGRAPGRRRWWRPEPGRAPGPRQRCAASRRGRGRRGRRGHCSAVPARVPGSRPAPARERERAPGPGRPDGCCARRDRRDQGCRCSRYRRSRDCCRRGPSDRRCSRSGARPGRPTSPRPSCGCCCCSTASRRECGRCGRCSRGGCCRCASTTGALTDAAVRSLELEALHEPHARLVRRRVQARAAGGPLGPEEAIAPLPGAEHVGVDAGAPADLADAHPGGGGGRHVGQRIWTGSGHAFPDPIDREPPRRPNASLGRISRRAPCS
jgi:hypothetical protein